MRMTLELDVDVEISPSGQSDTEGSTLHRRSTSVAKETAAVRKHMFEYSYDGSGLR